jgi:hypothetical protein
VRELNQTMRRRGSKVSLALLPAFILCTATRLTCAGTTAAADTDTRAALIRAAYDWRQATLSGDFSRQATFYPQVMDAFYLWRKVPRSAVIAEKRRVFAHARTVDIDIDAPQVLIDANALTARMYFRKTYEIEGNVNRKGEVLQELRWAKERDGWKIVSERDLRVIQQARKF